MFSSEQLIRFAGTMLVIAMPLLAGCGGSGPRAVNVSGTVTFNGQPVPQGKIYFDPDTAAGNDGVQGFARIQEGAYDTRDTGKGIGGGAYRVRIIGATAGENGPAKPLFGEYTVAVDFPQETTTHDFEVPASAAVGRRGTGAMIP